MSSIGESGERRFWLRFDDHDVELQPGETLIGRSPKCQLVLDDAMVSRKHARIVLNRDSVTLEDCGSVNGVLVNGQRLSRVRVLRTGDQVMIGQQSFEVFASTPDAEQPPRSRAVAQTLSGSAIKNMGLHSYADDKSEATREGDAFQLLAGVVEKVLALGRGDEAERILANYLRQLLQASRVAGRVDPEQADKASMYAVRIAEATGKGSWVDYAFQLHTIAKRPLPAEAVEKLYGSLRNVSAINLGVFRTYLSTLKSVEGHLGPSERFVVRRIQGLEALATSS